MTAFRNRKSSARRPFFFCRIGSRRMFWFFVIHWMWVMIFYSFTMSIFFLLFRGGRKLISVIFTAIVGPHQLSKFHNYINIAFTLIKSDALWTISLKNISAVLFVDPSRHLRGICSWTQSKKVFRDTNENALKINDCASCLWYFINSLSF